MTYCILKKKTNPFLHSWHTETTVQRLKSTTVHSISWDTWELWHLAKSKYSLHFSGYYQHHRNVLISFHIHEIKKEDSFFFLRHNKRVKRIRCQAKSNGASEHGHREGHFVLGSALDMNWDAIAVLEKSQENLLRLFLTNELTKASFRF